MIPTVSVVVLTYNHAPFIRDAIEGVLAQRTDFPIEVLVGDDASGDGTQLILRQLADANPGRLTLRLRTCNLGASANFADLIASCRGQFVAIVEGDDFWTEPTKLQRQVEFLGSNPDCSLCFHDAEIREEARPDVLNRYCEPKPPAKSGVTEIIRQNFVPTCSVVYRRNLLPEIPATIRHLPMQDWPCWTLLAQQGRLAYLDESWGCYRIHGSGIWSTRSTEYKLRKTIEFGDTMRRLLPVEYHHQIARLKKEHLAMLVSVLVGDGRWRDARAIAMRYLCLAPSRLRVPAGQGGLFLRLLLGLPSTPMRSRASSRAPDPRRGL